ncbi:DedA family protein [Pseudalkalibacillus decolorationis]|uniref:DedA family protein n=1 Tax=Pseudalkalibacillus decolorationis TaxID=163879 RepID=UPI002148A293|nr:DedA family protein [Pseudalkalibacillus decolorationis]
MNINDVIQAIETYGYWIILVTLFCGVVGIPAPEETFMVLVGMLIANHHLSMELSAGSAFIGTITGMIGAYWIGRSIGIPFVNKYGRFIKVTPERWSEMSEKFNRHGKLILLFGLFVPGLRQLAPYIAGTCKYPRYLYLVLTIIGSFLWTMFYIAAGYFVGETLPLQYLPWLGVAALVLFAGTIFIKKFSWKGGSRA